MRVAIDTGGTFTDCLFLRDGRIEILKIPSTPGNPAKAIADALESDSGRARRARIASELDLALRHHRGNERAAGAARRRVALVTTAGFEDVLEIGRQARPGLYDFSSSGRSLWCRASGRLGVRERVGCGWESRQAADRLAEVSRVLRRVRASRADSVAVCLLFSFLRPEHERQLAEALRRAGLGRFRVA